MLPFFVMSYLFAVGIVFGIAHFGPFAWFNYAAVIWFGGFLAVVLGIVYLVVRYRQRAASSGGARASKGTSKGARGGNHR